MRVCACVFLLNNAYSLRLTQRVDERRGGPFISGFTELLKASWEEGEILGGRVLRKASVITFSFQSPLLCHLARSFYGGAGCDGITNATRFKVQQRRGNDPEPRRVVNV